MTSDALSGMDVSLSLFLALQVNVAFMLRYFLAIPISEDAAKSLVAAQPPPVTGLRTVGRDELHLTLHFLGELPPQQADTASHALTTLRLKPFAINIRGVGRFPPMADARSLWAGVEANPALLALHLSTGEILQQSISFQVESRAYSPHISLAHLNAPAPPGFVERYLEQHAGFTALSILVEQFALYSSRFTQGLPPLYRREHVYCFAERRGLL